MIGILTKDSGVFLWGLSPLCENFCSCFFQKRRQSKILEYLQKIRHGVGFSVPDFFINMQGSRERAQSMAFWCCQRTKRAAQKHAEPLAAAGGENRAGSRKSIRVGSRKRCLHSRFLTRKARHIHTSACRIQSEDTNCGNPY